MNTGKFLQLEFFYRDGNTSDRKALHSIRSALLSAGIGFELVEKPVDEEHQTLRVPALPCLRRVSPIPERLLVGRFDSPEQLLVSLGLTELGLDRSARLSIHSDRHQPSVGDRSANAPLSPHFVYADDDSSMALLVKRALKRVAAENLVIHCENGEALLALLNDEGAELPRFILLDLHMPILNGLDALREIRQHRRFEKLPVVLFSSECNGEELQSALDLGVFDYKIKPHSFSELCEILKMLLDKFELLPDSE